MHRILGLLKVQIMEEKDRNFLFPKFVLCNESVPALRSSDHKCG